MSARAIRIWDGLHTWSSLLCTLFLFVLCATGMPLIFSDEISGAGQVAPLAVHVGQPLTIDQIIAAEHARHPEDIVQFVFFDEDAGTIGLGMAPTADADLEGVRRISFDPVTGETIPDAETAASNGVMEALLYLHKSLLLGPVGQLVLAIVALAFLVSLVSGIVLYAPFARAREFGRVRTSSRRMRWLDLHNVLGIVVAGWLLVVGATGLMNALEGQLFSAWNAELMPRLLEPYQGKPFPEKLVSPDLALARAKEATPGMEPTSIGFPYSNFGSPRHYLIWLKGDTTLTSRLFSVVLVDAASGDVSAAEPLPWYLRAVEVSRPLHFGDYGGIVLKVIWTCFDLLALFILSSGLYLWLTRRGGRQKRDGSAANAGAEA